MLEIDARLKAEIESICNNTAAPTFENTILAFDKAGEMLNKVSGVFFNLMECMSDEEMLNIAEEVSPLLSAHGDDIAIMRNVASITMQHSYQPTHWCWN